MRAHLAFSGMENKSVLGKRKTLTNNYTISSKVLKCTNQFSDSSPFQSALFYQISFYICKMKLIIVLSSEHCCEDSVRQCLPSRSRKGHINSVSMDSSQTMVLEKKKCHWNIHVYTHPLQTSGILSWRCIKNSLQSTATVDPNGK